MRSGRVIVDADNGGGAVGYGICKNFTWMDKAVVQQADCNSSVSQNLPCTVQGDTDEMFLSFFLKVGNMRKDIIRSCHPDIRSGGFVIASSQLETGNDLGGFGRADTVHLLKVFISEVVPVLLYEPPNLS
jgi:hypothetical protein